MCVAFLTKHGINSQWVQQELGIAYAFDKVIVPVIEMGVAYKGFVQMIRRIPYNPIDPDSMVYEIIYAARTHVIGYDAIPEGLAITCPSGHEHDYILPSNKEINHAIEAGDVFVFKCLTCQAQIQLSPRTLEILKII